MKSQVLRLLAFGAVVSFAAPAFAADPPKTPTFTKDIAPIFQEKCEACHRPDSMAPMSLDHLRGSAAVGAIDRAARRRRARCRRGTSTRPSASRSSRTTARSPTSRSTRSSTGSTPARRRATPRTCRRAEGVAATSRLELGDEVRPAGSRHQSPDYTMPAGRPGRVVAAGRRRPASPSRAGCARSKSARRP